MKSCHIEELMNNEFQFLEEDSQNSAATAIENSMPPEIPIRSKIELITEAVVQNISCELDCANIAYLNLFNNRIKKIQALDKLVSLNTLILSFNEIEAIEGLTECKLLKRLDLNHNFIRKIEGLEFKQNLQLLNLTNNWISEISQVEHLKQNCPSLKELSLKCNPLAASSKYRPTVFSKLAGSLIKLDGIALSDRDKERVKNDFISLSMDIIQESLKSSNKNISDLLKITKDGGHSDWERIIEALILNHK